MTTPPTDPYAVLGLTPQATPAQLRGVYRALLRRHHPDTRAPEPGDPVDSEDALSEVMAAYEVLRDAAVRAERERQHSSATTTARPTTIPVRRSADAPSEPPIKAGPVRWHRR